MGLQEKINANPTVYAVSASASTKFDVFDDLTDDDSVDPYEAEEVFGALSLTMHHCAVMDDRYEWSRRSFLCVWMCMRTEILRHINDPEHPLTLEQLKVMSLENIHIDDSKSLVTVFFTPTIPHCR